MLRFLRSSDSQSDKELRTFISQIFQIKPNDLELYRQAFRHKSATSSEEGLESNERLEFLGDAILDAAVTDMLYHRYPNKSEGELTKIRARIVSRETLNELAEVLDIKENIELKQEEQLEAGSIIGNTMEALFGAIYLDLGYRETHKVISRILTEEDSFDLDEVVEHDTDYKSQILIYSQRERVKVRFKTTDVLEHGNAREYTVELVIRDEVMGRGKGPSKKKAEQLAAKEALERLP